MKILILGGTGRLGQCLVSEAIKRGHDIHVLVRDKQKMLENGQNLTILKVFRQKKQI